MIHLSTEVALATVSRADVIVSWNFRHIVNLNRIRLFHAVNIENGYGMMEQLAGDPLWRKLEHRKTRSADAPGTGAAKKAS